MALNYHGLMILLIALLPAGLITAYALWLKRLQASSRLSPFKELSRRPAGEYLRLKLQALDEAMEFNILGLVLFPVTMVLAWLSQPNPGLMSFVLCGTVYAIATVYFGFKLSKLLPKRADYQLGYEGERYVGEELTRLIGLGFEIYHDVPFDGFNIDHVLVGARGVFIVETKTRRKPITVLGDKQYRVQFDGQRLIWPFGADGHGVQQAIGNAKTLSAWLGSACGEKVWVTPILTLPGWMVERMVPADGLHVLNPKEIKQVCASYSVQLSEGQVRRILHQMDQRCRLEVE